MSILIQPAKINGVKLAVKNFDVEVNRVISENDIIKECLGKCGTKYVYVKCKGESGLYRTETCLILQPEYRYLKYGLPHIPAEKEWYEKRKIEKENRLKEEEWRRNKQGEISPKTLIKSGEGYTASYSSNTHGGGGILEIPNCKTEEEAREVIKKYQEMLRTCPYA